MTTTTRTSSELPFSEAVKQASWEVHEHAEQSSFMQDLLAGRLPLAAFSGLVAQQYFAYVELERVATLMRDHPLARPFAAPELDRVPALESDLEALLGRGWRSAIEPTDATEQYCARLRATEAWPGGFVAHHYVRYMGDLSGGQIIRRIVERTYGIEDHRGTSFYYFDGIEDARAFKAAYRSNLDAAPWSPEERSAVVDEVLVAYRLNAGVLGSLT